MFSLNNSQCMVSFAASAWNNIRPTVLHEIQKCTSVGDMGRSNFNHIDTTSKSVLTNILMDFGFDRETISEGIQVMTPTQALSVADLDILHTPLVTAQTSHLLRHHANVPWTSTVGFQQTRGFKTDRIAKFVGFGKVAKKSSKGKTLGQVGKLDPPLTLKEFMDRHSSESEKSRLQLIEAYTFGFDSRNENKGRKNTSSVFTKFLVAGLSGVIIYVIFFNDSNQGSLKFPAPFVSQRWDFVDQINVHFSDVLGCDEVKKELQDMVEFLRNPSRFTKMGATLPKGVLLEGPPGVGKTLLAKAVAGEAGVPFIHICGSEFDEMFVGVGAARVRKLFIMAKSRSPCVIFIDELDAVGGKRDVSGLHPHSNQTIDMLLSEMDGFAASDGVIILAATNKKNHLDEALLRPGRFDTIIAVPRPDYAGRLNLYAHYLGKVIRAPNIDISRLAKLSTNFTGADIKNIVNQAAIIATLSSEGKVTTEHLNEAFDKNIMGPARSRLTDEKANKITAYHEAGHALTAYYTPNANPIHKVTIISRGGSLGHTSFISEEQYGITKAQLLAQMDTSMGGRVAEEFVFGTDHVTTGASSDFKAATACATHMVCDVGMSDKVGVRTLKTKEKLSGPMQTLVDSEIERLLKESYERSKTILIKHEKELHLVAEALLKYEVLDKEDIESIITTGKPLVAEQRVEEAVQMTTKQLIGNKIKSLGGFLSPTAGTNPGTISPPNPASPPIKPTGDVGSL